jgi:hypothetical protein
MDADSGTLADMKRYPEQTAVRLDTDVAEKLARIAVIEDRSVSSVIRRMVADAVAAYKLPSAPKPARKARAAKPAAAPVTPEPATEEPKTTAPF